MKTTVEPEADTTTPLLKSAPAFSSFSVDDLKKAAAFYGETLGLGIVEKPQGLELQIAGGHRIFVYPKEDHSPATFTILNFRVGDAEATVDELSKRGVRFEISREGEMKTDGKGIARGHGMKIAWFKDPAGNFLSVIEE
ncbi:MAG: VOC family protein [Thermoanaerobaculia bacterium]